MKNRFILGLFLLTLCSAREEEPSFPMASQMSSGIVLYEFPTLRAKKICAIKNSESDRIRILIPNVLECDGFIWQKVSFLEKTIGKTTFTEIVGYRPVLGYTDLRFWKDEKNLAYMDRAEMLKKANPDLYKIIYLEDTKEPMGLENKRLINAWFNLYLNDEKFQGPLRRGWQRMTESGDHCMILGFCRQYPVTSDAIFLSLIESSWFAHSENHAAAAGHWQFIPWTARRFGLTVSPLRDDRLNPVLSTNAAMQYLMKLYFYSEGWSNLWNKHSTRDDKWHFAFASYNRGEHKVRQTFALTKGHFSRYPNSFSSSIKYKETTNYVPKIYAARRFLKSYVEKNFFLFLNLPKTKADSSFYNYLYTREDILLENRPSVIDSVWQDIYLADQYSPFLSELQAEKQRTLDRIAEEKEKNLRVRRK